MIRVEIDSKTGERTEIPLTSSELAEAVSSKAKEDAERIPKQINEAADKAIAAMIPDAVIALVAWAEKQASGADKTTLKTMLDGFNAETAKKK